MKPFALGPQEELAAEQFRSFYAQLVGIRDAINATPASPVEGDAVAAAFAHQPTADTVRGQLARAITAFGYHPDAAETLGMVDPGYVMAAVADEVLLVQCPRWSGQAVWIEEPLEFRLYGSRLAGDRVFEALDELIRRDRADPRTAMVILLALLSGFRGRFEGRSDHGEIWRWQQALYELVCRQPYVADDPAPYNLPDVSGVTLTGESMRPLPRLWPWIVGLIVVVLVYLPVSHLVWWLQAERVYHRAEAIVKDEPAAIPIRPRP
ncbi:DotU family type IV/VI secretion system protein [Sphingomonas sp. R-74633]|uniref:DotU family type IV/VI secretion system protein n=1 Tax=Sphingomonas sp. R-74633 TaxID=2751188 RepID=UPI0015D226D6|nr:DotU family type IV/VI secretion system protein [Sphingomonas sp. R-74633]NYT43200.1 DotU family type IV/VI secretion system protein [Sphingomonas sp. R-74633]